MESFEKFGRPKENLEEERFFEFIEKQSEKLRAEGVPVNNEGRIEMDAFSEIYPDVETDKNFVKEREKQWYPNVAEKDLIDEKRKKSGEKLEMLKTGLFSKFLGENFIVVRSSAYDDIKNGIDNVILEKETGNVICAFDEVADTQSKEYQFKVNEVVKKNKKEGGGKLKYGLKMENGKLALGKCQSAPIFYLALPERHLNEAIKKFIPSFEEKSDYEKQLFKYFMGSIKNQYDLLKLDTHLDPSLKEHLGIFKETIKQFEEASK